MPGGEECLEIQLPPWLERPHWWGSRRRSPTPFSTPPANASASCRSRQTSSSEGAVHSKSKREQLAGQIMITRRLILAGTGGIAALAASAPSSTPPAETVGRAMAPILNLWGMRNYPANRRGCPALSFRAGHLRDRKSAHGYREEKRRAAILWTRPETKPPP